MSAHPYVRDTAVPPDHKGRSYCLTCGAREDNDRHDTAALDAAQREHQRRTGDREDDDVQP